ncbi:MAG TPA: serine hydrolase domain-containing protein [Candidatus Saccharimonadales bacterium]|nr:serine hydrolase domain-containing protein [Candidatus Saccharimonadales bacterium]
MGRKTLSTEVNLVDSTGDQERRFAEAFRLIEEAISQRAFPGASLAVTLGDKLVAWRNFGRFTYEAGAPAVTRETVWDLASLTKVLATTSMAMLLVERGRLRLDARVVELLPEFGTSHLHQEREQKTSAEESEYSSPHMPKEGICGPPVSVRMLLAHSSGLPAHRKLYLDAQGREAMLEAARRVPLEAAPMARAEYSDIGFIVLGELLERVAGKTLDRFCAEEVFGRLDLNLKYASHGALLQGVPSTAIDSEYRGRVVQGEVNDENASAMGGVAGHAGLFGDSLSVARLAHCLLSGGAPVFKAETVELFTRREDRPKGTSRALGWDTPSRPSQSGTRFSARSFGHLGYTGTSLWCDPERGLSVTLLTNRTWPDAKNQAIKEVRPAVHDAIVAALENR